MEFPELDELISLLDDDTQEGWCTSCGEWTHDCCDPDSRKVKCPVCERPTVYGAQEILFMIQP